MPYFKEALTLTLAHEGGYANDPADRGGETYRGIARKYHPAWPGWGRVGELLSTVSGRALEEDAMLAAAVEDFYRAEFWEPIGGDDIDDIELACKLFDCAVNLGVGRAVWFLQRALNALSQRGRISGYLEADRRYGPATRRALKSQLAAKGAGALIKCIEGLRIVHYLNIIDHDPTQARFAHGWLARVGRAR